MNDDFGSATLNTILYKSTSESVEQGYLCQTNYQS